MTGGNPFPGLRAFGVEESHLFFGRERPTDELLRKLRTNRFIAVVGTSGSGKSSLVRAGMLPDLHGGLMTSAGSSWRVALFRPGNAPIRAMAEALSRPDVFGSADADAGLKTAITETVLRRGAGGLVTATLQARMASDENLLVVVDQFEELFRFKSAGSDVRAADEAAAFVKLLLEASTQDSVPVYVVLTMRSEFLGDCTQFRDLPEAINAGQYLIPRMTRDQQKEAIAGPVAVGGARLTPRLLQRLLNDVGDNPDQLPILQHAMMRTWDNWVHRSRPDEPIDIPHYEAIGTMTEALSRHADEAFNELPDRTHRWLAEKIFKRLTEKGTDNRELRLPAQVDELCSITGATTRQVISVIDVFRREGRWFLMPPPAVALDETTLIDISHESLIRIWTRLRRWVNEEAESSRIYRRLAETSALYPREAGLWRDPDLQIALQWRESNDPNQAWARRYSAEFDNAMQFLDESKAAARRRWLLVMAPVVLIPLLLIGLGTGFAVYGWLEAEQLAREQMERAEEERERNDEALAELNAIKVEEEENQQKQQVQEEVIETARRIVASEGPGQDDDSQLSAELLQAVIELEELEERESETAAATEPDGTGRLAVADRNAATAALDGPGATDPEVEANVVLGASADSENPVPSRELEAAVDGTVIASSPGLETAVDGTTSLPMPEPAASAVTIRVGEFVTSRDVIRLEPQNIGDEFPPGKVTAFARVYSPSAESLTIRWYADGDEELRRREVMVQPNMASGYRIYDWKTLAEPGSYAVRLFDAGQEELGRLEFEIDPDVELSEEAVDELEEREPEMAAAAESDEIGRLAVADRNAATAALDGPGATDPEVEANVALSASAGSENLVPSEEFEAAVDGTVLASSPGLETAVDGTMSVPMSEPAASAATIRVGEFVTSRDVIRLEPQNIGDEFPPGKVTAFARVYSPSAESLTIRWYADGDEELRSREVTVQPNMASGYRIYDWKTLAEPGSYEVRLFDAGQDELGRLTFEIDPEMRD